MLGEPLLRLDSTDSTNRVALDWSDAPDGAAVVARAQSEGRGRLGRSWESAAGKGLYLSLILRGRTLGAPLYSLVSALGLARATRQLSGIPCRVKWPNDVLAMTSESEARKIGGILGEGRGDRSVIGIGLNVNQLRQELPERAVFPASSLAIESGKNWEIEAVLNAILAELNLLFGRLEAGEWSALRGEFEGLCLGVGDVVRVAGQRELMGMFEAVGEDGALLLRTADGLQRVLAGDVNYF